MNTKKYTTVTIERNESYKKFMEMCQKNGLKKKVILNMLIEEFTKNPNKFLSLNNN